jgi:hypothetical protein
MTALSGRYGSVPREIQWDRGIVAERGKGTEYSIPEQDSIEHGIWKMAEA